MNTEQPSQDGVICTVNSLAAMWKVDAEVLRLKSEKRIYIRIGLVSVLLFQIKISSRV